MKAAAFAYHRPDTVAEAVQMLGEFGEDAKILAGGQSLVPMLAMRLTYFEHIIDISRVAELQNIELRDDQVWIGAGTPHALVGMDDEVADVGAAADVVDAVHRPLPNPDPGHSWWRDRARRPGRASTRRWRLRWTRRWRRRRLVVAGRFRRREFFTGLWETSLEPDEILTAVRFPVWGGRSGFAIEEFARRHGDFAIAGAAVALELDDDDRVARCGIGLLGLGSTPLRGSVAEDAVVGQPAAAITAEEIGRLAMSGLSDIPADLQGSADYRSRVGATMVARAWTGAVREANTTEAIHA